jgi:hypothetical protein
MCMAFKYLLACYHLIRMISTRFIPLPFNTYDIHNYFSLLQFNTYESYKPFSLFLFNTYDINKFFSLLVPYSMKDIYKIF